MTDLQCIVVTPEQTVCDTPAEFVALTLFDGEIGIAAGHTPLIGRLGFGEMRIKLDHQVTHYYVEGGFVEVADNVVSVLTNRAVPVEKLDARAAAQQLEAAKARPATTPELMAIRDQAVAQSRAQLHLARS